jgi:hypothetical protein
MDAVIYSDDSASILTNLEKEEAVLSGLGETRMPRIVTISGCGSLMVPILSKGYLDPCQLCNLVARLSIINADFIVLVLPRSAPETPDSLGGSLTHTACLVLKAGYSITLRVVSQDYVLLLADDERGLHVCTNLDGPDVVLVTAEPVPLLRRP